MTSYQIERFHVNIYQHNMLYMRYMLPGIFFLYLVYIYMLYTLYNIGLIMSHDDIKRKPAIVYPLKKKNIP